MYNIRHIGKKLCVGYFCVSLSRNIFKNFFYFFFFIFLFFFYYYYFFISPFWVWFKKNGELRIRHKMNQWQTVCFSNYRYSHCFPFTKQVNAIIFKYKESKFFKGSKELEKDLVNSKSLVAINTLRLIFGPTVYFMQKFFLLMIITLLNMLKTTNKFWYSNTWKRQKVS